jgi:hypothetical protein
MRCTTVTRECRRRQKYFVVGANNKLALSAVIGPSQCSDPEVRVSGGAIAVHLRYQDHGEPIEASHMA